MAQVILGKNLHDLRTALQAREDMEHDMEQLIQDFQAARSTIKTFNGLIPICAWCKKVRDDLGYWEQVEAYITNTTGVDTTGSICPECSQKHFRDVCGAGKESD